MRRAFAPLALLLPLLAWVPARGAQLTSCTECHADAARTGHPGWENIVDEFEKDAHAAVGISCHDCHGGNPELALAADPGAAMDSDFAANPYVGSPERREIPEFCGRCHSDPVYMRNFDPAARVDQVAEYWTSRHGQLLLDGDQKVATCIDCHGIHGMLHSSDADSPVYPTRVAETCRRCHGDATRMEGYSLPDGSPLPIDQYAHWRRSVHADALLERGDVSAPTCNDCHGNHGASLPGLASAAFACGRCHGREADLFRKSPKHAGFTQHNVYLAEATCGDCHTAEPMVSVTGVRHFTECATCHDNHAIVRPNIAMLGPLPETPCALCHESEAALLLRESGRDAQEEERFTSLRDALLEQAEKRGLGGDDRFDWLVEQTRALEPHTETRPEGRVLRPRFGELLEKFRIGTTYFAYDDPTTGKSSRHPLTRCTTCHGPEVDLAAEPVGYRTSVDFLAQMQELTIATAQAERTMLSAQRGGVALRGARGDLDAAIDAQIQLSALVHGFSDAADGGFDTTHGEGLANANEALAKARKALREIDYRRRGLVVSLGIIVLVLIGLALKIREISRRRAGEPRND